MHSDGRRRQRYIDFSSGIYVTTLGHCHPKVTEAVQPRAGS
jgi:4-aminobutyrate aminotransferase-like enzyme